MEKQRRDFVAQRAEKGKTFWKSKEETLLPKKQRGEKLFGKARKEIFAQKSEKFKQ